MNKAEPRFKEKLISLLSTRTLDQISVSFLCDELGYNRQTFYYHYRDIYDLVQSILLAENIGSKFINNYDDIIVSAANYIKKNYDFLNGLIRSHLDDLIEEMFYSYFYKHLHLLIEKSYKINNDNVKKDIKRYLSNLLSKETTFWIINKCSEKKDLFCKRLSLLSKYFLDEYIEDYGRMIAND